MIPDIKQFLVRTSKQTFRVAIPSTWKVTFGPTGPPRDAGYERHQRGWVLRFYEAENRQRACFTNVIEFYDLSIPMDVLVMADEQGKSGWVRIQGFVEIPRTKKKASQVLALAEVAEVEE